MRMPDPMTMAIQDGAHDMSRSKLFSNTSLVFTVCTASRLEVMSYPVDCVVQARYHETLAKYMESRQNTRVLWLLVVKYAIYRK